MIDYIRLLRPRQWLKNLMLFFPPFLGGMLLDLRSLGAGLVPFVSFCLASSSTYIFNDLFDADRDVHHPKKRNRPIPSGAIDPHIASIIGVLLGVSGCVLAWRVSLLFFVVLCFYICNSLAYTLKLKSLPLFDLFSISAGFLLRLLAGGEAFGVPISDWLFLSVFLLSLFLSTGKRLSEKIALGDDAAEHRQSLSSYSEIYLQGAMFMTGAVVLVTYTMYVISRNTLIYTVPLCAFGLMRHVLRIESGKSGDPTESLLRDGPLFAVSLLWVVMVGLGIYG
jgi:decaprenyl-phosphate phosphoribosyltransferase